MIGDRIFLNRLKQHLSRVQDLSFSNDGEYLASMGSRDALKKTMEGCHTSVQAVLLNKDLLPLIFCRFSTFGKFLGS